MFLRDVHLLPSGVFLLQAFKSYPEQGIYGLSFYLEIHFNDIHIKRVTKFDELIFLKIYINEKPSCALVPSATYYIAWHHVILDLGTTHNSDVKLVFEGMCFWYQKDAVSWGPCSLLKTK